MATAEQGGWFRKRADRKPQLRVLTAAATRIDLTDRVQARRERALRQGWQSDAWGYRDSIGELRYAIQFLANCTARMRFYPAAYPLGGESDNPQPIAHLYDAVDSDDPTPTAKPPANLATLCDQAMSQLGHGKLAISHIAQSLSTNTTVAGESWMLGRENPETGQEEWSVRSVDEIVIRDDRWQMREIPSDPQGVVPWVDLDPDTTVLTRIWTPHPRFRLLADSPLRAMLDDCESLMILRRMIRATGRSRLAGAGLLGIPEELSIKVPTDDDGDPQADPFFEELTTAMMEPIADEGVASAVVPVVLRGPGEHLKNIVHINLASQFAEQDSKTRQELIGIIATGMDLPKEVIMGVADLNHWCQDEQTEVLTQRGWLGHDEITAGDVALSLNHETGLSEWQPVTDVYRAQVVDEPMLSFEHRMHSSLTTMNHRWPVLTRRGRDQRWLREWRTSGEFRVQDHIVVAASSTAPATAKHSDALVELVAWLWTEGGLNYREGRDHPQVSIYQSPSANPDNVARIRAALTELYGPPTVGPLGAGGRGKAASDGIARWRETTKGEQTVFRLNVEASRPLVEIAPRRHVSTAWIRELTAAQLELFIETSIRADGCTNSRTGQRTIGQKDPTLLEGFELAAILAGYSLTHTTVEHDGFRPHVQHTITLGRRTTVGMQRGRRETVRYTGTVWCPTVEGNHSFLARRNGHVYFTGNSAWQVDDSTFRHHVEPHVITVCDGLTGAYLRPYLRANGIPEEWVQRTLLWYDPTELVTHPDRAADAQKAYDAQALSRAAYLGYLGFSEDEAPSIEELEMRRVMDIRALPLNLLMEYASRADPSLVVPPMAGPPALPGIKQGGGVDVAIEAPAAPGAPGALPVAGPHPTPPPPDQPHTGPPQVPGVTAAGPPERVTQDRASRKLSDLDRDLRTRLQTAANAAMLRQLERAGARLVSKVAKDETLRAKIAHRPKERAAAIIGEPVLTAAGITASQLLGGDWSGLRAQFMQWVAATQKRALQTAVKLASVPSQTAASAQDRLDQDRESAWQLMVNALDKLAEHLLYNPDPNTPAGDWGDHNPDTLVPAGLVRAALAVAGGAGTDAVSVGADGSTSQTGFVGQIGTGETVSGLLTEAGGQRDTWEWHHSSMVLDPFEPHLELDGVQFASFDDQVLANKGGWPPVDFYFPGDHRGDSCDVLPLWSFPGSPINDSSTAEGGE